VHSAALLAEAVSILSVSYGPNARAPLTHTELLWKLAVAAPRPRFGIKVRATSNDDLSMRSATALCAFDAQGSLRTRVSAIATCPATSIEYEFWRRWCRSITS